MKVIPFEIAKKLKEKGFDWFCSHYYRTKSKDLFMIFPCEDWSIIKERVNAPTISQAMDWLRVNKEVDLVIKPSFLYDDNLNRIREYNCDIFAPQLNKPYHTDYYDSYELAALVGIEYVLDNLI